MEIYETTSHHSRYGNGTNSANVSVDGGSKVKCYRVDSSGHLLPTADTTSSLVGTLFSHPKQILIQTLLPIGYPHSVKKEYLEYQCWDAVQGMCSYLRAVLTTRSVLASVGVGNTEATALSAALSWVLKDGLGMVGSLFVAYCYSKSFEVYTKEWRLLADVLNNIGLTLDLLCSMFPSYYFVFLVVSSIAKSCCGLIAGATKARISSHFAERGHLADVSAKESTQETAIALLGLVFGMLLAKYVGNDEWSTWVWFLAFTAMHLFSNYNLIRVLVFHTLNTQRLYLIAKLSQSSTSTSDAKDKLSPMNIAKQESLLLPFWLTWFGPKLSVSLTDIQQSLQGRGVLLTFGALLEICQDHPYLITWTKSNQVIVALEQQAEDKDLIEAYFIACCISLELQQHPSLVLDATTLKALLTKFRSRFEALLPVLNELKWEMEDSASLGAADWRYHCQKMKQKNQ